MHFSQTVSRNLIGERLFFPFQDVPLSWQGRQAWHRAPVNVKTWRKKKGRGAVGKADYRNLIERSKQIRGGERQSFGKRTLSSRVGDPRKGASGGKKDF